MAQTWRDLLFAHWPLHPEALRQHLPAGLQLDTFDRQAWIGIVPFTITELRLRWLPPIPGLSSFPELNVRTYVTAEGKPGVWFFSLDAGNAVAVAAARAWFHLPYFRARMQSQERNGWIQYRSERSQAGASPATFEGNYRPIGAVFNAQPASLEYFLTERYCLYSSDSQGHLYRGEIHHPPWPLKLAEAKFTQNTMAEAAGFALPPQKPLLHFARRQHMVAWAPQRIKS
jgi:uncharacterized protein YqjF (DUF2071 family)